MKSTFRLLSVSFIVSVAACASTTFTSTWKAPDAQALDPRGHKIAAVFISSDEAGRHVAEDVLVRKLAEHGAQGGATYSLIPSSELTKMSFIKQRLAEAGVDGVLTVRVIDEKEKATITLAGPSPVNSSNLEKFVARLADQAAKQMMQQGVLAATLDAPSRVAGAARAAALTP